MELAGQSKSKMTAAADDQLMDSSADAQQEEYGPTRSPKTNIQQAQGLEGESQTTSLTFEFSAINFDKKLLRKKKRGFADVELMNASSELVVYKMKCDHYYDMTAKPNFFGILEPGERYNLQLIVFPQSLGVLRRNFLLFETFFVGGSEVYDQDYTSSSASNIDIVRVWENVLESDLTRTKLGITFKPFTNREKEITERYVVHFDRFPDQTEKSRLDRYRKIIEQLKRENIASLSLLFLIGLFLVGCFFGDVYQMDDRILDIF
uniref:MSP domain-containing protein n=1 Tax=Romanomermis culicivorax TaxID=13658 RepID=A0A915KPF8_ROMCU